MMDRRLDSHSADQIGLACHCSADRIAVYDPATYDLQGDAWSELLLGESTDASQFLLGAVGGETGLLASRARRGHLSLGEGHSSILHRGASRPIAATTGKIHLTNIIT